MTDRKRLGFVGLGLMGAPMTRRLLAQGWSVTVWNLEPERYAEVPGAVVVGSPAEVRAASDIVLFCVLDAKAVEACCFGPDGLAQAEGGATLLIDTSTINPDKAREFAARLKAQAGMDWVDAPLSGGPPLAGTGKLTALVGGDTASVEAAWPVLADIAANATHLGPLGAGQTAKIVNQAIVGASYMLMAETLALSKAAGLDPAKLPGALAGGLADSQALQRIYPQMAARDWDPPRGYARQLDKDLKNLAGFAEELGLELPLIEQVVARYHAWSAAGNEMKDGTAVAEIYEKPQRRPEEA
ncbi:NAD(P)-dependent oxidoreductase [Phenylobacterium deserti]|uniref:NAD(P)-dependent oxidoreductase n=1 Tax=Phenylobacterium deserti TaxID=1914756 RepID=A0A328A8I5_9CAUL|nr:NAD(P)-dependent oxidoreductase [Phenylobacterium deserti]RAK50841.1 NAD(P)-dependent oxidoreductase [Phenylobacterium deserti]